MGPRSAVLATTVLAFCTLYAPQPILPLLTVELGVDPAASALLVTATLLPLGIAPVFYGYLLARMPAALMLRRSVLALAAIQALIPLAGGFWPLLALRLVQGLILPAIFTAAMTFVAAAAPQGAVQRAMRLYVACTIFGGFAGRAASGLLADVASWRVTFALLACALVLAYLRLRSMPDRADARFARVPPRVAFQVLRRPELRRGFAVIFLAFFAFASLLNTMPFRLVELRPQSSGSEIAVLYLGYLVGIAAALGAGRAAQLLGGEVRAMRLGLAGLAGAVAAAAAPAPAALHVAMIVLCAGMFLVHAVLSGLLNQLAGERRGVVNGLYVAAYYLGGTAGSVLPWFVYRDLGWTGYCLCLGMAIGAALLSTRATGRPAPPGPPGRGSGRSLE